jgi:RNA polymerase sigma-70 factor (ECF subfamily)
MIADLAQLHATPAWDDATATAAWLAERNEDAARWLVATHGPLVARLVQARLADPHTAEDVRQNVWLAVFRALPRYDAGRPFATWLARIAINACHDALRAQRRARLEYAATPPDTALAPAADAPCLARERRTVVQRLLAPLGRDAELLWAFHGEGRSAQEVGARFDLSPGGVRLRVFRALQTLRRRAAIAPALCPK